MTSMYLKTVNLYWLSVLTINYSNKSGALQKAPLLLFQYGIFIIITIP